MWRGIKIGLDRNSDTAVPQANNSTIEFIGTSPPIHVLMLSSKRILRIANYGHLQPV